MSRFIYTLQTIIDPEVSEKDDWRDYYGNAPDVAFTTLADIIRQVRDEVAKELCELEDNLPDDQQADIPLLEDFDAVLARAEQFFTTSLSDPFTYEAVGLQWVVARVELRGILPA